MGLKSLMEVLKKRVTGPPDISDTPDTPEKNMGYQRKAPVHAVCTPDTPDTSCFGNTSVDAQFGQFAEAASAPASAAPAIDWRELDRAYQDHHFKCCICQAAGRGLSDGLRCGAGSALWVAYSADTQRTSP